MRITLNGLELSRAADGSETVGQVLAQVMEEIHRNGKVVTRVFMDDRALPEGWQRRHWLSARVTTVQTLELTVEESADLVQRTLEDTTRLVERMAKQTATLAAKFRVGDEVVANNELAAFLDDLQLIVSGLDHVTRRAGDETARPQVRTRIMREADRLLPTLDRMYKAQALADYIALADELEYELPEQMAAWRTLTEDVRRWSQVPVTSS